MAGPQGRANPNQTGGHQGGVGAAGGRSDGRRGGPQGRANPSQTGRDQRKGDRPGGDHPGRVGGEQAQGASSANAPSVDRFKDARGALGDRIRDEADLDNTPIEDIGNVLAGLAGFHELEPEFDINNLNEEADWGFDVVGALAGLAGMATGFPGLGTVVGAVEDVLGIRDDVSVNLGPNVFEDDDELPAGTEMLAGRSGLDTAADEAPDEGAGGLDDVDSGRDTDKTAPRPSMLRKPPKRAPKPPKPYSTIGLGDVVSVADYLGI